MGLIFEDTMIDEEIPFHGECGFCGHGDARHRIFDAIIDIPEDINVIAHDYDLPENVIERIRKLRPYRKI